MFYSQDGQDAFLEKKVFKGLYSGVFVDVGAHDGLTINNTLFFERERGWTGVNVEANPEVYKKLVVNRPQCANICCAVSDRDGEAEFIFNQGYTEMISGLKDHYDPRHETRLKTELSFFGGDTKTIRVPTRRLEGILEEHKIQRVHYLSIDVEGAEKAVIESIDFSKVFIDVIGFENNFPDISEKILKYLEKFGYCFLDCEGRRTDVFVIHKKSEFFT